MSKVIESSKAAQMFFFIAAQVSLIMGACLAIRSSFGGLGLMMLASLIIMWILGMCRWSSQQQSAQVAS